MVDNAVAILESCDKLVPALLQCYKFTTFQSVLKCVFSSVNAVLSNTLKFNEKPPLFAENASLTCRTCKLV